jgi:hypothetical protein
MSKVERVWFSNSFNNTSIYARLRLMLHEQPGIKRTDEEKERLADMFKRYNDGIGLSNGDMPLKFCGENTDTRLKKLPHFFYADGFFVVSEQCAEIFRQFELGNGGLHPVEIFQGDRRTRLADSFFLLSLGCQKQAFLPEHSNPERFERLATTPVRWLSFIVGDDDCAVSRDALIGCDLWVDTNVRKGLFLSDPLVKALRAAKVTRTINLARCRVIESTADASRH